MIDKAKHIAAAAEALALFFRKVAALLMRTLLRI